MKNILIIIMIVFAMGYMFVVLSDKYESIKSTNETIKQTQQQNK
jgi:CHASE3 domain sensor protein